MSPYLLPAIWTVPALLGLILRVLLLAKFLGDLRASRELRLNGNRRLVLAWAIENTVIHLLIKLGIVGVGLVALLGPVSPPNGPELVLTGVLVAIPLLLTYNALRQYAYQRHMLHLAGHGQDEHQTQSVTDQLASIQTQLTALQGEHHKLLEHLQTQTKTLKRVAGALKAEINR